MNARPRPCDCGAAGRQLEALPAQTRRLLALAAADPSGDLSLVWQAAGRLGMPLGAAAPAETAGLVDFGTRVQFRHPLARSAAYRSAPPADRREMHAALAEVTDPGRRAWHRAQAAAGPDEEVAAELEQSAGRAGPRRAGRGRRVPGTLGAADGRPRPSR